MSIFQTEILVRMIKYLFSDFRANFTLYFKVTISSIAVNKIIMGMPKVDIGQQVCQFGFHVLLKKFN